MRKLGCQAEKMLVCCEKLKNYCVRCTGLIDDKKYVRKLCTKVTYPWQESLHIEQVSAVNIV